MYESAARLERLAEKALALTAEPRAKREVRSVLCHTGSDVRAAPLLGAREDACSEGCGLCKVHAAFISTCAQYRCDYLSMVYEHALLIDDQPHALSHNCDITCIPYCGSLHVCINITCTHNLVLLNTANEGNIQDIFAIYLQVCNISETNSAVFSSNMIQKFLLFDHHFWSMTSCHLNNVR